MAEPLVGLRVAAPAVPQPQIRRRFLPSARLIPFRRGRLCTARAAVAGPPEVDEDEAMSIDNLHRFFDLNVGKWNGSFYQFEAREAAAGDQHAAIREHLRGGRPHQPVAIVILPVIFAIHVKSCSIKFDEDDSGPEWVEYKIKETNMFTVDKYQQDNISTKTGTSRLQRSTGQVQQITICSCLMEATK